MSEQCEIYNLQKAYAQEKRAANTIYSTNLIKHLGLNYESKNFGAHIIIKNRWDFWPSTGLFIDRKSKKKGRGVRNLIKIVKKEL